MRPSALSSGAAGVRALLAALYPCPLSFSGQHLIPRGERGCLVPGCTYGHATGPRRPVYHVTKYGGRE